MSIAFPTLRTQRTRRTQNLRYLEIICLHRLADMVQVTPLQNNLLRALYMMNNEGITPQFDDLLEASQMLPSDCSFLALLLSYWTYHIDLEWFQSSSTMKSWFPRLSYVPSQPLVMLGGFTSWTKKACSIKSSKSISRTIWFWEERIRQV